MRDHGANSVRWRLATLLGGWLICVAPLFFARVPPTVDYPNHLARVHILSHWGSQPDWALFYHPDWRLYSNLGLDLLAAPLARSLGTEWAGWLVWLLMVSAIYWGGVALHRALTGQTSALAALPALAVYGAPVAYGFVNFALGTGLCLLAVAAHVVLRERTLLRSISAGVFAVALFMTHLMTLAVFLLLIALYDAIAHRADASHETAAGVRRWLAAGMAVLVGVALALTSETTRESGVLVFRGVAWKLKGLALTFNTGFSAGDLALAAGLALIVGWLLWRKVLTMSRPGLVLFGAMALVFMSAPYRLRGIELIDFRMTQFLALLGLCSLKFARPVCPIRSGVWVLAALLARSLFVGSTYAHGSAVYSQLRADLGRIPREAIVVGAMAQDGVEILKGHWYPPLHLAYSLCVLDGQAYISHNFMEASSHPLELTELGWKMRLSLEVPRGQSGSREYWTREAARCRGVMASEQATRGRPGYFYLVKPAETRASSTGLPVIAEGERYAILRFK